MSGQLTWHEALHVWENRLGRINKRLRRLSDYPDVIKIADEARECRILAKEMARLRLESADSIVKEKETAQ